MSTALHVKSSRFAGLGLMVRLHGDRLLFVAGLAVALTCAGVLVNLAAPF